MAQLWRQNSKDDSERLCLIDFVHPDSPVLKSVIITAKDRMAKITGERWEKAVAELPAYVAPSEWVNDPSRTMNGYPGKSKHSTRRCANKRSAMR